MSRFACGLGFGGFWFFGVVRSFVGQFGCFVLLVAGCALRAGLLCAFLSIPPLYIDSTGA